MNRIFSAENPGNAFRSTDAPSAIQGGKYKLDGGQRTFTDGQGNKIWLADTSGGAVTITLPDPTKCAPDRIYTVKRTTGGANALVVQPQSGTIDGASSHSIMVQYLSYSYVSDGANYWIV